MFYRHFLYLYLVAEVMSEILTDTHIHKIAYVQKHAHRCAHTCTQGDDNKGDNKLVWSTSGLMICRGEGNYSTN